MLIWGKRRKGKENSMHRRPVQAHTARKPCVEIRDYGLQKTKATAEEETETKASHWRSSAMKSELKQWLGISNSFLLRSLKILPRPFTIPARSWPELKTGSQCFNSLQFSFLPLPKNENRSNMSLSHACFWRGQWWIGQSEVSANFNTSLPPAPNPGNGKGSVDSSEPNYGSRCWSECNAFKQLHHHHHIVTTTIITPPSPSPSPPHCCPPVPPHHCCQHHDIIQNKSTSQQRNTKPNCLLILKSFLLDSVTANYG